MIMDSWENGRKEYVVLNISLSVREHLVRQVLWTNVLLGTIGGVLDKNVIGSTQKSTIGMKGKQSSFRVNLYPFYLGHLKGYLKP